MGFYLKKSIAYLLNPLTLVFILLLLSLGSLFKKRPRPAIFLLTASILLLWLFGSKPFSNALMHPLESRYRKLQDPPKTISYIVFLGGDLERRGWEVLRLHQLLPKARIITTGYQGNYDESEALRNKRVLVASGIEPGQIIPLPKPKDTLDEAKAVKKLLGARPFILVTSAYHMPRAMMIFEREGLRPLPAPADLPRPSHRFWKLTPGIKNLETTQKALHEYLGILWLKIREIF